MSVDNNMPVDNNMSVDNSMSVDNNMSADSVDHVNLYPSIENGNLTETAKDWKQNYQYFIQEKYDGSQFTICPNITAYYCGKSKKSLQDKDLLFNKVILIIQGTKLKDLLNPTYTYHVEYIASLRHNVITYKRLPKYYMILYDVQREDKSFMKPEELELEGKRIGLEVAKCFYSNNDPAVHPYEKVKELMKGIQEGTIESSLGGPIEGVVLKCNNFEKKYGHDHPSKISNTKLKFVSKAFKEVKHVKKPKHGKQTPSEFLQYLGSMYHTDARLRKGIQHLREKYNVHYNPQEQDVKKQDEYLNCLYQELDVDLLKEHKEELHVYLTIESEAWFKLAKKLHIKQPKKIDDNISDLVQDEHFQFILQHINEFDKTDYTEQHINQLINQVCKYARGEETLLYNSSIFSTISNIYEQ